jgi:hypothetical protein
MDAISDALAAIEPPNVPGPRGTLEDVHRR